MSVYVIRRKGDTEGLCKIGYSKDIDKRVGGMSTGNPDGFDVLVSISGGRPLERRLHDRFASKRVAGEWFRLSQADLDYIANVKGESDPLSGRVYPLPAAEDEFSPDIIRETRFYLNELVKREWRGMGDTVEAARDRLMTRLGLDPAYGARLWLKPSEMKDVNGEPYRCLHLAYAIECFKENKLTDKQKWAIRHSREAYEKGWALAVFEQDFNEANRGPASQGD
jgi:hypothetical protein